MLGAGLRREFPGAYEWAGRVRQRVPRPRVSRSGLGWAVLAGLGANALVPTLLGLLAFVIFSLVDLRTWGTSVVARELAGVVVGAAIAMRAGSWRGLVGLAAALAGMQLVELALGAPGRAIACERVPQLCADRSPYDEVVARWPLIVGVVGGLILTRAVRSGRRGANPSLEAVGLMVVLFLVARVVAAPLGGPVGEEAVRGWIAVTILCMPISALAGHVLVRRGAAPWPAGVLLGAAYFGASWLPGAVMYLQSRPTAPPDAGDWLFIAPIGWALAFVLASVVTAAFARPRPPGADAARRGAR